MIRAAIKCQERFEAARNDVKLLGAVIEMDNAPGEG